MIVIGVSAQNAEKRKKLKKIKQNDEARKQKVMELTKKFSLDNPKITDKLFKWGTAGNLRYAITFNKEDRELCYIDNKEQRYSFSPTEILKCELRTTSRTISNGLTHKKGITKRAIIGGVIAGGAGAVVGGLSGKENHTTKTRNILTYYLDIYTDNPMLPILTLTGWEDSLRKWYSYLLMLQSNEKESKNPKNDNNSSASELFKLKEMLDSNLITREEFLVEKGKIVKNG